MNNKKTKTGTEYVQDERKLEEEEEEKEIKKIYIEMM